MAINHQKVDKTALINRIKTQPPKNPSRRHNLLFIVSKVTELMHSKQLRSTFSTFITKVHSQSNVLVQNRVYFPQVQFLLSLIAFFYL